MQYIDALTNTFTWVKNLFLYDSEDSARDLKVADLFEPIENGLAVKPPFIDSAESWNSATQGVLGDLFGMYNHTDRLDAYYETFNNQLNTRMLRARESFQQAYSEFLMIKSIQDVGGNSITLKGGLLENVDTNPALYRTYDLMKLNPFEGTYTLKDTGYFSAIRSKAGSLAKFYVEHSTLPIMEEEGKYEYVTDGLKRTHWLGKTWAKSLVRSTAEDLTWAPADHREGFCVMGTMKLERPIVMSEITINPSLESPAIISRISWTPFSISDFLAQTFEGGSGWASSNPSWSLTGSGTTISETEGVDNSGAAKIVVSSNFTQQYLSHTFRVADAYAASIATVTGQSGSGQLTDTRLEVAYRVKGTGTPIQGRVEWLNSSGTVIATEIQRSYSSGIYTTYSFSAYRPDNAVSGRISIGFIEEIDRGATLYVDYVQAWMGEKIWNPDYTIFKETTLTLPFRVMATRVSVVMSQKNPIRELEKEEFLRYSVGFREVDLLYREYVPRGAIVSKTFKTRKEIRKFWLTAELANSNKNGLSFIVYPYADDRSYQVNVAPHIIYSKGLDTDLTTELGETFEVYTTEEWENDYVTSDNSVNLVILDPIQKTDIFDGTDREGKVQLTAPMHFRRYPFNTVIDFLDNYGYDPLYDPNAQTVFGVASGASGVLEDLLLGEISATEVLASSLISIAGYRPISVTIDTDRYTANPDLSGIPRAKYVKTRTLEALATTSVVRETTSTDSQPIGYSEWLSKTTLQDLVSFGFLKSLVTRTGWPFDRSNLPFRLPAGNNMQTTIQQCIGVDPRAANETKLKSWYDQLYANGQLSSAISQTTTVTETNSSQDAFKTKFAPIISGPNGTALKVYQSDQSTLIPPSQYTVNTNSGTIILNTPATGIYATYSYVIDPKNKAESEDFETADNPEFSGYLTRNMTDYETGVIPTLRAFQPDPIRNDYYPVIEYYVTPDSQIVFSRDFFKYGDQPATIKVKYESLNIQPKFSVYGVRVTSPTQSPSLKSITFNFKETGATL